MKTHDLLAQCFSPVLQQLLSGAAGFIVELSVGGDGRDTIVGEGELIGIVQPRKLRLVL